MELGLSGLLAAAVAAISLRLPFWMASVAAVAFGGVVVILLALIFKAATTEKRDNRTLPQLSGLVLDIHRRVNVVRETLIRKTNWAEVDTSKVTDALFDIVGSSGIDDEEIEAIQDKLTQSGGASYGIASVPNAIMKESNTDLSSWLKRDFRYNILCARLDSYKPFSSKMIGDKVMRILNTSFSLNNALILQKYAPSTLTLADLSALTSMSDVRRMKVYSTNVDAEKVINDAVEEACNELKETVERYLLNKMRKQ